MGRTGTWKVDDATSSLQRLVRQRAAERGVEIIGDFNDRYAFNEQPEYVSSPTIVDAIIDGGFAEVQRMIDLVREPMS